MKPSPLPSFCIAAILAASALPSDAQISVANSDFLRSNTTATSFTKSFDAGATADKLIVSAAFEGGPANSALTITYNGVALTTIPGTPGTRNEGIWYLDNPFTGGAADIVITGGGANIPGMGMGIVSIAGSADGYAVAGKSGSSVTLNVPVADCFVFANCAANDGVIPTPAAPLTELYKGGLPSSEGAAGYATGVASGSQSFSFTGSLTSPETSAAAFVPASAAPVIISLNPADDATNAVSGANLVATFSEPVVAGTGNITLHLTSDNSVVETFVVTSDVIFSGQQLTIDPTSNLTPGAGYYIQIAATAVVDTSGGNSFAGIADTTTWSFVTDGTPPSLVSLSPADNAGGVQLDSNLVATFDEAVVAGTGNITLHLASDDSVVETFVVTSDVTFSGQQLTINPTSDLTSGVGYYVQIAATAIDDTSGNSFVGIANTTTWNFSTDGTPPSIATLSPADNDTNVPISSNLVATFNENVVAGMGNITLHLASNNSVVETFVVTSDVVISGSGLTIDPTSDLTPGVGYYVQIAASAIDDLAGNSFAGIADTTTWNFTADGTPPSIATLSPVDDATDVPIGSNLVVTFNETVVAGTGNITLHLASDNSVVETFVVTSDVVISGANVTIDPTSNLDPLTGYYVTIAATAVKDTSGNTFAGLAGAAAWNFTTAAIHPPIVAVNSGNFGGTAPPANGIVTSSVTVGATADMLILMTSMELGNTAGTSSNLSVTYGGVQMIRATGNTLHSNIYYLDLSTPGISGTNVVVDMTEFETRNGFAAGWVSIDGNLAVGESIALHSIGTAGGASHTVGLTTSVETFNVVNFNGNANTGTVTVNSPNPTVIYTDTNIGSANAAAAYAAEVAAGTSTYEWTLGNPGAADANYRRIDAAAFEVVSGGGGNTYTDWIGGFPGVGSQTALNDDSDGDGIDNGVENYFGTNPGVFSQGLVAGSVNTGAKTFTFTHPLNATPASDLTATYRWSTDLANFYDAGSPNGAGTTTVTFAQGAPSGGQVTVTATISGTVTPDKLFVAIKVTQN